MGDGRDIGAKLPQFLEPEFGVIRWSAAILEDGRHDEHVGALLIGANIEVVRCALT